MDNLHILKLKIEKIRSMLEYMLNHTKKYSSTDILDLSQQLDILINEYNAVKNKHSRTL